MVSLICFDRNLFCCFGHKKRGEAGWGEPTSNEGATARESSRADGSRRAPRDSSSTAAAAAASTWWGRLRAGEQPAWELLKPHTNTTTGAAADLHTSIKLVGRLRDSWHFLFLPADSYNPQACKPAILRVFGCKWDCLDLLVAEGVCLDVSRRR